MAASYLNDWHPDAKEAANTALLGIIDRATGPGTITIHDSADVELASIALDDPGGTVDGTTGVLTLAIDVREESATAGTAAYATLRDGDGVAISSVECQQGTEAVPGKCVLASLTIVAGAPVEIVGWTIG